MWGVLLPAACGGEEMVVTETSLVTVHLEVTAPSNKVVAAEFVASASVDGSILAMQVKEKQDGVIDWDVMLPIGRYDVSAKPCAVLTHTTNGAQCIVAAECTQFETKNVEVMKGSASANSLSAVFSCPLDISIAEPVDGMQVFAGDHVLFRAAARGTDGDRLIGQSLRWQSDLEGEIGTGSLLSNDSLRIGTHTITLEAVDKQGAKGVATKIVTVQAPPSEDLCKLSDRAALVGQEEEDFTHRTPLGPAARRDVADTVLLGTSGQNAAPGSQNAIFAQSGADLLQTSSVVGDTHVFHVHHSQQNALVATEFTLKIVEEKFSIWVETAELGQGVPADEVLEAMRVAMAELTPLGSINDQAGIFANNELIFGEPPDQDGDGNADRTHVLLVRLEPSLAGFVNACDVHAARLQCAGGNNANVMYINTRQRNQVSSTIQMVTTIAHEYQHLIQFRYHLAPDTFVNEGLSEWALNVNGYDQVPWFYLQSTEEVGAIRLMSFRAEPRAPNGEDHLRAALFTIYLAERLGPVATGSMTQIPGNSAEAVCGSADDKGTIFRGYDCVISSRKSGKRHICGSPLWVRNGWASND